MLLHDNKGNGQSLGPGSSRTWTVEADVTHMHEAQLQCSIGCVGSCQQVLCLAQV